MKKTKMFRKAVDLGAAGTAIAMKVFLTMTSPAEFSRDWLRSLSDDELGIQIEKAKLQQLRKDKKAGKKLDLLNAEKKRRQDK